MATTKVSALSAKTALAGSEELLINDGGTSKKVTATNLLAGAAVSDGSISTSKIADDAVTEAKLANAINTAIAANTAKTSNATHTGDVTGATSLTIANDAVTVAHLNLISTGSVPSLEAKGTSGVTDGYIQLNCAENSHGIKLKSPPHSAGASYTLTFPNDDGSNGQKLTTNGSGVLTWTADTDTVYTHPNHSGEVTSTADGATVIADNVVDEANLKISNTPTNGYVLTAQSGNTGGLTWAEISSGNTTANGMWEHAHTISSNYSITSGNNAMAAGPITINSGVSVTVPTGSTWVIA